MKCRNTGKRAEENAPKWEYPIRGVEKEDPVHSNLHCVEHKVST